MEVQYIEAKDIALFDGHKFRKDKKTGYYLNSTLGIRLHRYIWHFHYGDIPEGCHIHHIDGDKDNNEISNLALLRAGDHMRLHGLTLPEDKINEKRRNMAEKALPAAVKWHKSAAAREWHKEQAKRSILTIKPREMICEECGKTYLSKDHGTNRFCSNACRAAYRRRSHIDDESRKCAVCGEPFKANKYSNIRTCSRQCGNVLRVQTRARNKEQSR